MTAPATLPSTDPLARAGERAHGGSPVGIAVAALGRARRSARERRTDGVDAAIFPARDGVAHVVELLSAALFPRRLGRFRGPLAQEDAFVAAKLIAAAAALEREVAAELGYWSAEARGTRFEEDQPATIVRLFLLGLGEIRTLIDGDIAAAFLGDPAARSQDEILVSYPGAIATLHHRVAHRLHDLGAPIVARLISALANERTGIDIHPGATIGGHFFIDHGTGVVIGETAIVGERVRLYQHVTLGARTPLADDARIHTRLARHPIVEDDVVIYAGSTILGRVTIGRGATIGGNVWLLDDVPPGAIVLQPEARVLDAAEAALVRDTLVGR